MLRNKYVLAIASAAVVATSVLSTASFAGDRSSKVVIVPARRRVVRLLHDIWRKKQITLICYQGEVDTEVPSLHSWNGWEWVATTVEFETSPETVILVGDDNTVPTVVRTDLERQAGLRRIASLDMVAITKGLISPLEIRDSELKGLAKRHGMSFTDLNAERRKWGRYGKPGTKKDPMPPPNIVEPTDKKPIPDDVVPDEPELKPVGEDAAPVKAPEEVPEVPESAAPMDAGPTPEDK